MSRHPLHDVRRRRRRGEDRPPGAARLLGRRDEHVVPLAARALTALPLPADDAAGRLPRHDLVDPALGGRLDGLVVASGLGQRLDEDQPRVRLRVPAHGGHAQVEHPAAHRDDLGLAARPGPVGEDEPLPDRAPAHRRGVVALRPVEDDDVTGDPAVEGRRVDEVDRQRHGGRSLSGP